ncbi:MAG: hypothetical protein ACRBEE_00965 [Arenicella sp.]
MEKMSKHYLATIALASIMVIVSGCSDNTSDKQIAKPQRDALKKAKQVEQQLLENKQKLDKKIEEEVNY